MSASLGVVVPAYRPDVDRLGAYVAAVRRELDPAALRIELDAADPDVEAAVRDLPATVHAADERRGKGAAITCGFEHLDTELLAFADADGSTPADSLAAVVDPLLSGRADLAAGSRRHPDAHVQSHQTLARRFLGDGFAWLARRFLDAALHDYQCGAKALTRDTWTAVRDHLYESGFGWDVELVAVASALDRTVVEVPVTWEDRPGSTVAPVDATVDLFRALATVRLRTWHLRGHPLGLALDGDAEPLVERLASADA